MRIGLKTLCVCLAIFTFAILMPISLTAASPVFDRGRQGSITIRISAENSNSSSSGITSGVKFTLFKVASISDNGKFNSTDDFVNSGVDLNILTESSEFLNASKEFAAYASDKKITSLPGITDSNGSVTFQGLSIGCYLAVKQDTSTSQNGSLSCEPFLVSVPMTNSSGDGWIYDINANPKIETDSTTNTLISTKTVDLPKTGGSIFDTLCKYSGMILIICGAAIFALTLLPHKKR